MRDSLKDFIDQNRDDFDDKEPNQKGWDNIVPTFLIR